MAAQEADSSCAMIPGLCTWWEDPKPSWTQYLQSRFFPHLFSVLHVDTSELIQALDEILVDPKEQHKKTKYSMRKKKKKKCPKELSDLFNTRVSNGLISICVEVSWHPDVEFFPPFYKVKSIDMAGEWDGGHGVVILKAVRLFLLPSDFQTHFFPKDFF